jgi:hypothetical protein
MKKLIVTCLIMAALAVLSNIASANINNGGFESGDLTGWTPDYTNDGSNWGSSYELSVTNSYYHSGQNALWGYAYIVGDISYWEEDDWEHTYVWSESQDLSNVASIKLYLTAFQSNPDPFGWGFGQDVYLMLDDGPNSVSVLLIDNHQYPYTSLFDAGHYTTSVGSDDGTWYGFDVPLSTDPNYFGAEFSSLDLSNAKVGIRWEARNWYDTSSQTLWVGAAVDDIELVYIPEPATICLLGLGALSLIRRKKH